MIRTVSDDLTMLVEDKKHKIEVNQQKEQMLEKVEDTLVGQVMSRK